MPDGRSKGGRATGGPDGPVDPSLEISRKLKRLAIPALLVFVVGVILLGVYYASPVAARTDLLFYGATALTFGALIVLFPVAKVYLLLPNASRVAAKKR